MHVGVVTVFYRHSNSGMLYIMSSWMCSGALVHAGMAMAGPYDR